MKLIDFTTFGFVVLPFHFTHVPFYITMSENNITGAVVSVYYSRNVRISWNEHTTNIMHKQIQCINSVTFLWVWGWWRTSNNLQL